MSMCKIPPTTLVAFNITSQLIQQNGTSIPIDPSLPTAIYQAISDITSGSINSKVKGRDTTQLEKLIMDTLKNMGNNNYYSYVKELIYEFLGTYVFEKQKRLMKRIDT